MRLCSIFILVIGVFYFVDMASAIELKASANLTATAGLDKKTTALIEKLPEDLKNNLIKALKEMLPTIDTSVINYLQAVDSIVAKRFIQLECRGRGAVKGAVDDFKSKLPWGETPAPVTKLKDNIEQKVKKFSANYTPDQYSVAYSEVLYQGELTACEVDNISQEASAEVSKIIENIRPKWLLWHRLDEVCNNAENCFNKLFNSTNILIAKSDRRDVGAVNARSRMKNIKKPDFSAGFFSKWNPRESEDALLHLLSIQDGIKLAYSARRAKAKSYADESNRLLRRAEQILSAAKENVETHHTDGRRRILEMCRNAFNNCEKAKKHFAKAHEYDIKVYTNAIGVSDKCSSVMDSAKEIEEHITRQDDDNVFHQLFRWIK